MGKAGRKGKLADLADSRSDWYYREHYPDTSFDVIVLDGQPVGRLYVARWSDEIRIVDIALLPACCNRGLVTTLVRALQAEAAASRKPRLRASRYGGQAAAHPRRTLQSRAAALRTPRVPTDRG